MNFTELNKQETATISGGITVISMGPSGIKTGVVCPEVITNSTTWDYIKSSVKNFACEAAKNDIENDYLICAAGAGCFI